MKRRARVAGDAGRDRRPPGRGALIRELLLLALVYLILEAGLRALVSTGALQSLQFWTAGAADALLEVFGIRTVLSGCSLVTTAGSVTVEGLCLPITPLAFGAALLGVSVKGSWRRRACFGIALLVSLAVASVARIAVVAALLDSGSPLMAPMHETYTPLALIAVPLVLWLVALRGDRHA